MSEELDQILAFFEQKNWKELNKIIHRYNEYTLPQDIEKEVHSLLIATDASSYIAWLSSDGKGFKELSDTTLKKLYNGLV